MAKLPKNGAKRNVADFVQKKVGDNFRAIQPMILSEVDGTYYWSVKVIEVKPADENMGIARKYEAGFIIVSHGDNINKIKEVFKALKDEKKSKKRIPLLQ